jgi:pimeloyl-ACP methyl ester carboxylesterase
MSDNAPTWFSAALAAPVEVGQVPTGSVTLSYRAWGPVGRPCVLLVHGVAAHARWWDHIGPALAEAVPGGLRVVAVDLAGHGESGSHPRYSIQGWGDDVLAVGATCGTRPAIVVGHSLGGMVALAAAGRSPGAVAGVVAIESCVRRRSRADDEARICRAIRPKRVYPSRELSVAGFRLRPPQEVPDYVLRHIARSSVCRGAGGWTAKHDPAIFDRQSMAPADLIPLDCPSALIRARGGLLTESIAHDMARRIGARTQVSVLDSTGHHVMLDRSRELVGELSRLLTDWIVG